VKAESPWEPALELPPPLTMRLYAGAEVIFSSEKHWLHPLFELENFFSQSGRDPARTCLVDRVTGRAAAFLVVRLGIRGLRTLVLSRRAIPVLERYGVHYRCREETDRVLCATEDLLADTQDPEAAWSLLQQRRAGIR
jgi:zinc transport system ATP-binding protein